MQNKTFLTLKELKSQYGELRYIESELKHFIASDFNIQVANNTINMLRGCIKYLVNGSQVRYGFDVLDESKKSFKDQLDDNDFSELDYRLDAIHQFIIDEYNTDECLFTYDNDISDKPMKISSFVNFVNELNEKRGL